MALEALEANGYTEAVTYGTGGVEEGSGCTEGVTYGVNAHQFAA